MNAGSWSAAALCAAALQAQWAFAQWSFQLDTSFGTEILQQNVNDVLLLQSGRLFTSGRIRFQGDMTDRGSARLLPNGQRDLTYTGFFGGEKIAPWTNGQFYVSNGLPRRMLVDGMVDPSFIALYNGPYFQPGTTGDYHVFPDGRVLISGSHLLSDSIRGFEGLYELIWFTNEGYLDTTRTHRNANGPIWEFKELPNGQFICSCNCTQYEGQPVSKLFRVNADGSLDPSFQPGINWGNINAYHGLPDGRVYAAGKYKRAVAPDDTLYIARFMPDGALDPGFSPPHLDPEWLPNPASGALATLIYPWYGGRLLFTGRFLSVNGLGRSGIAMIDSTGEVLSAFDGCGVAAWTYQGFTYVDIEDIEPDGPDTLYICGAYVGFDDCAIDDNTQRFVSRLLVTDLGTGSQSGGVPLGTVPRFSVQPNPAHSWVAFTFNLGAAAQEHGRIVVQDLAGRPVASLNMNGTQGQVVLDTRSLAQGTYTVLYHANGQLLGRDKLIIQQ